MTLQVAEKLAKKSRFLGAEAFGMTQTKNCFGTAEAVPLRNRR
jgi:hypothetical protein